MPKKSEIDKKKLEEDLIERPPRLMMDAKGQK